MHRIAYLLALPLLGPIGTAIAASGPPCICHPLDIGAAESLPFGKGPFDVDPSFPLDKVVPDTLRILAASEEPLVHMETLRRAAIYLTGIGGGGERMDPDSKDRGVRIDTLIDALQNRTREAAGEPTSAGPKEAGASKPPSALRHLDLGYAIAALGQAGAKRSEDWAKHLEKAAALSPDVGAFHFASALAAFDGSRDRKAYLGSLRKALDLASDPKGLLRKNLVSTFGKFLDAPTFEGLEAKVRERLGSS